MNIWDNKHTLMERYICDAPIIQIRPSRERSNLYVFSEDGYVHHVDGYDFSVINSIKISKNRLTCIEEVSVRSARGFVVADVKGNLTLFNSSFDSPKKLGEKDGAITAIQCIGRSRVLISYSIGDNKVRVEMISPISGRYITKLEIDDVKRIRDFHCPTARWNKNDGWIVAATDNAVVTINFKMYKLSKKSFVKIRPEFFIDEIATDVIRQKLAGKTIVALDERKKYWSLSDIEQKKSTVSLEYDTQVFTEDNRLYVRDLKGVNELVELGDDEVVLKNLHEPEGRVSCGTTDGRLLVVDYRMNSMRFICDA